MGRLTQRKIDPSVIKDPSVGRLDVVEAGDQVGVDRGLDLEPSGCPLTLQQVDRPNDRNPGSFVI